VRIHTEQKHTSKGRGGRGREEKGKRMELGEGIER